MGTSKWYVDGSAIRTILFQQAHRATGRLRGVMAPKSSRGTMGFSSRRRRVARLGIYHGRCPRWVRLGLRLERKWKMAWREKSPTMLELRTCKSHDGHVMIKNILDLCRTLYMASYVTSVFNSLKLNNDVFFLVRELVNNLDGLTAQPISKARSTILPPLSIRIIRALCYKITYLVSIPQLRTVASVVSEKRYLGDHNFPTQLRFLKHTIA